MAVSVVKLNPQGVRELLHAPGLIKHMEGLLESAAADYPYETKIETEVYASGRAISKLTDTRPDSLHREAHTHRLADTLAETGAKPNEPGTSWGPRR